jgi:hypothetical protein
MCKREEKQQSERKRCGLMVFFDEEVGVFHEVLLRTRQIYINIYPGWKIDDY